VYREFIITKDFDRYWHLAGLADEDLRALQNRLLDNPKTGTVIRGTNGLRKIRAPLRYKGKSGGIRVIYLDVAEERRIYLILVYPKKVKENLNDSDRKQLAQMALILKGSTKNESE
jgi:hypothetical protein